MQSIDLRTLRESTGISRRDVAEALGLSANSGRITVAQIEGREDWLLSSLSAYLHAIGADVELLVKLNDEEVRFKL